MTGMERADASRTPISALVFKPESFRAIPLVAVGTALFQAGHAPPYWTAAAHHPYLSIPRLVRRTHASEACCHGGLYKKN